jgi:hypothetical protein
VSTATIRFLDCSPIDGEMREWVRPLPDSLELPQFVTHFAAVGAEGPEPAEVSTPTRRYLRMGLVKERRDDAGKLIYPEAVVYAWENIVQWARR